MPGNRDIITAPGLVGDMDEDWYHADPVQGGSLSVSGAKKLLPPGCPAVFRYEQDHPRHSKAMDLGTVVHGMLLGTGQEVEIIDADSYRTRAAQEMRDKATEAGRVPMLLKDYEQAEAIAQAVRDDDECAGLLAEGDSEVSGFAVDDEFGIWLRMRLDRLTWFDGMPTIVDVKTAKDSSPTEFAKAVAEYRYDMQDSWYRELLAILLHCDPEDIDFVFVVVPTAEPYLPMTYRIDDERDRANAAQQCRQAREIFRDCTEGNVWPKWSRDITPLSLPGWARKQIEESIHEYYD